MQASRLNEFKTEVSEVFKNSCFDPHFFQLTASANVGFQAKRLLLVSAGVRLLVAPLVCPGDERGGITALTGQTDTLLRVILGVSAVQSFILSVLVDAMLVYGSSAFAESAAICSSILQHIRWCEGISDAREIVLKLHEAVQVTLVHKYSFF